MASETLPGALSGGLLPQCLLTHAPYTPAPSHTYTHHWISNTPNVSGQPTSILKCKFSSTVPTQLLSEQLEAELVEGGGGRTAKINPIFCSFSVSGYNPLLASLPLHRWGIRLASGLAPSHGEGDRPGRDRVGEGWKCSVTGLRITASIRPGTLFHLP